MPWFISLVMTRGSVTWPGYGCPLSPVNKYGSKLRQIHPQPTPSQSFHTYLTWPNPTVHLHLTTSADDSGDITRPDFKTTLKEVSFQPGDIVCFFLVTAQGSSDTLLDMSGPSTVTHSEPPPRASMVVGSCGTYWFGEFPPSLWSRGDYFRKLFPLNLDILRGILP